MSLLLRSEVQYLVLSLVQRCRQTFLTEVPRAKRKNLCFSSGVTLYEPYCFLAERTSQGRCRFPPKIPSHFLPPVLSGLCRTSFVSPTRPRINYNTHNRYVQYIQDETLFTEQSSDAGLKYAHDFVLMSTYAHRNIYFRRCPFVCRVNVLLAYRGHQLATTTAQTSTPLPPSPPRLQRPASVLTPISRFSGGGIAVYGSRDTARTNAQTTVHVYSV